MRWCLSLLFPALLVAGACGSPRSSGGDESAAGDGDGDGDVDCPEGWLECEVGIHSFCVDPNRAVTRCGACDIDCWDGGQALGWCVAGECVPLCGEVFGPDSNRCNYNPPKTPTTECCPGCEEPDDEPPFGCDYTCDGCVPECPTEATSCDGYCADLSSDWRACGECGVECPPLSHCVGGECVCYGQGQMCEGQCVDLLSDAEHCGECGQGCPAGEVCSNAECICALQCGGSCVDPMTDDDNCGGCGIVCDPSLAECVDGWCTDLLGGADPSGPGEPR